MVRDPKLKKVALWTYFKGAMRDPGLDEGATTVAYLPNKGWFWYIPLSGDTVSVGIVAEKIIFLTARRKITPRFLTGKSRTTNGSKIICRELNKPANTGLPVSFPIATVIVRKTDWFWPEMPSVFLIRFSHRVFSLPSKAVSCWLMKSIRSWHRESQSHRLLSNAMENECNPP